MQDLYFVSCDLEERFGRSQISVNFASPIHSCLSMIGSALSLCVVDLLLVAGSLVLYLVAYEHELQNFVVHEQI